MKVINDNITVSKPLLDSLKEAYPDRLPVDKISLEEFRFLQGQQSIINYLQVLYEEDLQEN
jgi:hypothetical protein